MKILSTSALAAIVAFGAIAGPAPSEGARDHDEGKIYRPLATRFFQSNCW